jgi:signal transduction histidine kinase/CheY-like chemotaxis protein/HPt (histidine-containing phosphotransfer) domain-containing protein
MINPRLRNYRLHAMFGLALAAVAIIVVVSYRNTNASLDAAARIAHTHEVISTLHATMATVENAETTQRLYVITGKPEDLLASRRSHAVPDVAAARLASLVADNPDQGLRVKELRAAIDRKLRHLDRVVETRRVQGFDAARRFRETGEGTIAMERVRNLIAAMIGVENELLAVRELRSQREARFTILTLTIGGALNFVLLTTVFILMVRDDRRRRDVARAMRAARDSALQTAETRAIFLANMSHEIRTPLNGIIGMTGLLLASKLDEDQRNLAETVRSSADSLLRVINDILDFSKIEAGKLLIEESDFDLRATVESVAEMLSTAAHAKDLEIGVLVDHDIPPFVRGDDGRLRQVLVNLVGNAVKFTTQGYVVVQVNRERDDEHGRLQVRFAVTDTGIGLSDEERRRLFQPFSQADTSTTRQYGGTGLGLAISRQLVELMGGTIDVDSVAGKGSTFWFALPLERVVWEREQTSPQVDLQSLRVLVVDDNETNRALIRHQLSAWSMAHEDSADGIDALARLRNAVEEDRPFNVALIDRVMPEMDGLDLTRRIKADSGIAAVKVVILTSSAERLATAELPLLGVDAWLTKPVKQSSLYDALITVMSDRPARRQGELSAPMPARSIRDDIRILVVEDNPVNKEVAVRQLARLGYRADVAGNGLEAVEALRRMPYHLVFMDCQMPEMDGFDATRAIRKDEGDERRTPIIALTANAREGDRERCLAAGMDGYLSKPTRESDMAEVLNRWLPGETVSDPLDLEVLDGLRALGQGTDDFIREVAALYLEDSPRRLASIGDAAAGGDARALASAAHALKSSSTHMGAVDVRRLCDTLERMADRGELASAAPVIERLRVEYERAEASLRELIRD